MMKTLVAVAVLANLAMVTVPANAAPMSMHHMMAVCSSNFSSAFCGTLSHDQMMMLMDLIRHNGHP